MSGPQTIVKLPLEQMHEAACFRAFELLDDGSMSIPVHDAPFLARLFGMSDDALPPNDALALARAVDESGSDRLNYPQLSELVARMRDALVPQTLGDWPKALAAVVAAPAQELCARLCTVSGAGVRTARAGHESRFDIHIYKWPLSLPPPKCAAKATRGPRPLPVLVRRVADGHFRATYTPKAAGTYSLSVSVGNYPVHGAPFALVAHADSSAAARSMLLVDSLQGAAAGSEAFALLEMRSAAGLVRRSPADRIEAAVRAPDGAVLPCTVRAGEGGLTELAFWPAVVGRHTLTVAINGVPLPAAPFLVRAGPPSAATSEVWLLPSGGAAAQREPLPAQLAHDAGEAPLRLLLVPRDQDGNACDVGQWAAAAEETAARAARAAGGAPLAARANSAPTGAGAAAHGFEVLAVRSAPPGTRPPAPVRAKIAVQQPQGLEEAGGDGGNVLVASLPLRVAGTSQLHVLLHGVAIAASPYSVRVLPSQVSPDASELLGMPQAAVLAGTRLSLRLLLVDRGGNRRPRGGERVRATLCRAAISGEATAGQKELTTDAGAGQWATPRAVSKASAPSARPLLASPAGEHMGRGEGVRPVAYDSGDEAEAIAEAEVEAEAEGRHGCQAWAEPGRPAHQPHAVSARTVRTPGMDGTSARDTTAVEARYALADAAPRAGQGGKDKDGGAEGGMGAADEEGEGEEAEEVRVSDEGDGSYALAFALRKAGRFRLRTQINGQPGPSGLLRVVPDSTSATASGFVAPEAVEAGESVCVHVWARDAYANARGVGGDIAELRLERLASPGEDGEKAVGGRLDGGATLPSKPQIAQAVDMGDGSYELRATVFAAGRYALRVWLNGEAVGGSAAELVVRAGARAADRTLLRAAWLSSGGRLVAGSEAAFSLVGTDAFGNPTADGAVDEPIQPRGAVRAQQGERQAGPGAQDTALGRLQLQLRAYALGPSGARSAELDRPAFVWRLQRTPDGGAQGAATLYRAGQVEVELIGIPYAGLAGPADSRALEPAERARALAIGGRAQGRGSAPLGACGDGTAPRGAASSGLRFAHSSGTAAATADGNARPQRREVVLAGPFTLRVLPSSLAPERCVALGAAVRSARAAELNSFVVRLRDAFGNDVRTNGAAIEVQLRPARAATPTWAKGSAPHDGAAAVPVRVSELPEGAGYEIGYVLDRAAHYELHVRVADATAAAGGRKHDAASAPAAQLDAGGHRTQGFVELLSEPQHIEGSPFSLVCTPGRAHPPSCVLRSSPRAITVEAPGLAEDAGRDGWLSRQQRGQEYSQPPPHVDASRAGPAARGLAATSIRPGARAAAAAVRRAVVGSVAAGVGSFEIELRDAALNLVPVQWQADADRTINVHVRASRCPTARVRSELAGSIPAQVLTAIRSCASRVHLRHAGDWQRAHPAQGASDCRARRVRRRLFSHAARLVQPRGERARRRPRGGQRDRRACALARARLRRRVRRLAKRRSRGGGVAVGGAEARPCAAARGARR